MIAMYFAILEFGYFAARGFSMRVLIPLIIFVWTIIGLASAEDFRTIRSGEATTILPSDSDECGGTYIQNCDGTFEYAYLWNYGGIVPPYYGAFGEAYDVGCISIECASLFLTTAGGGFGEAIDLFIWEGGISTAPGAVHTMLTTLIPYNVPYWPTIGQNDFEVGCTVSGEFTLGFWSNNPYFNPYFIASDENGPGGHPWTNIAPGIGYPTGWNHPNVVWPDCQSLGIGFYVLEAPSPVSVGTWGSIKALFK